MLIGTNYIGFNVESKGATVAALACRALHNHR